MWKRDAVFDDARMGPLAREDLFEKCFGLVDFPAADVGCEHVHDFADRIRRFSRAQPHDHLLFLEQIYGCDRHWGGRDLLEYGANAVIQLNNKLWQPKIQRSRRKRNGQFPCRGALTTRAMSTQCGIFMGASLGGAGCGDDGSMAHPTW